MTSRWTNLALAVSPEIDNHANQVVDRRVGGLVEKSRGQGRQRENGEAELERSVDSRARYEANRPFQGEHKKTENEVDCLESRNRSDGSVQCPGQEVPEDLGPEVALNGSCDLVCN